MTPMIDMVFLLIAFFAVLVNFGEADRNQAVKLPSSELAMPPKVSPEQPITLGVGLPPGIDPDSTLPNSADINWKIYIAGDDNTAGYNLGDLSQQLEKRKSYIMALDGADFRRTTIILRAHQECPTGRVLEVVDICQQAKFEKFKMRAMFQSSAITRMDNTSR